MEKKNIYQMVTDRIIEQLKNGVIPWHKPWNSNVMGDDAVNYITRKPYSLINQFLLGWKAGEYLTFNQVQKLGGKVRKGAKSKFVVFYTMENISKKKEIDENGEEQTIIMRKKYNCPILKSYNVFHIDDCEGIETKFEIPEETEETKKNPITSAENIINDYLQRDGKLRFENDRLRGNAFYSLLEDKVYVPMMRQYCITEEYYGTVFHEFTHSTMHPDRCNRKAEIKNAAFGSEDYSKEELVAELGSAILCNIAGLNCDKAFNNSVSYIKGWLTALKEDSRLIISASTRAEKAVKYILNK